MLTVEVVQAYRFALDPSPGQEQVLAAHCGASRAALNIMLAAVMANLDQRSAEKSYGLSDPQLTPTINWSAYSLRKEWNQRKAIVAPWWANNSKEAYSSGCFNLAAALASWSQSKKE